MQEITEMFLPAINTFLLSVEYVTLQVLYLDCLLLGACFHSPQGSIHLGEVIVFCGRLQGFCFSLPESLPVFLYRGVSDAIQATIFSHVAPKTGSSAELYDV